jgi:RNase P/RNase MRP subunit p29
MTDGAHLGRETRHATCEALIGHRTRVAHQTLHRLRVYERQSHLQLHQRTHLLKLQLREGETGVIQAKRLLLLDGRRWRAILRRWRTLVSCRCRRLGLHPLKGLELEEIW